MKTYVYVDGFNLYYGLRYAISLDQKRSQGYKWLDLEALSKSLLPRDEIVKIKYFTADVKPRSNDKQQLSRQLIYQRALQTIPSLEIIKGRFLSSVTSMPMASDPKKKVKVIKTEEKGSDVNIATHLLADGFLSRYEKAVVISNDSDLVLPVEMVQSTLNIKVGVIIPPTKYPSYHLIQSASFHRTLRSKTIQKSQFPHEMVDSNGKIYKPKAW